MPLRIPLVIGTGSIFLMLSAGCERHSEESESMNRETTIEEVHTNRLANEKSPYLKLHAHNPVDWYPWGKEAFERAKAENKPVFLSVGYATCHWCHVMERETFSNEEIAEFLNQYFVCIKLDREERPDIDRIYIAFLEMNTGDAGWPMSVFLTPEKKPFFGGTYYPPESRDGQTGFLELSKRIQQLWSEDRERVIATSDTVFDQVRSHLTAGAENGDSNPDEKLIGDAIDRIKDHYDPEHGGFQDSPKFPTPAVPAFLLAQGARSGKPEWIDMVVHTCERMAAGGIHDQLGGGFSRYSVDEEWLVPHFEKMLYDNAQLLELYLDVYLKTGDERHASVARGIADYVLRDMTDPLGGFYSAENADSEGYEGKFYVWTMAELRDLLADDEFSVVQRHYGITEEGNFVDHSHSDPISGQNVLSVADPDLTESERQILKSAKRKMSEQRAKRVRPSLDNKVLTSWNGLMLGSLARASVVLGEPEYLAAARKNFSFIKESLWDASSETLYHRWCDGESDNVQLLEDHAALLKGCIDLYETTLSAEYLDFSVTLADVMIERFEDGDGGGFWQINPMEGEALFKMKDLEDGAFPSGNSLAAHSLLRLADITDRSGYRRSAEKTLRLAMDHMKRWPTSSAQMLKALGYALTEPVSIVIDGEPPPPKRAEWLAAAHSVYLPFRVITSGEGSEGQAHICVGKTCLAPTGDPARIRETLQGELPAGSRNITSP